MEKRNNYYPIEGKLYLKKDEVQITDSFKKREFVLEVTSDYGGKIFTELISFELLQGACEKLDYVDVGATIEVMFSCRGREYDKKDKATGQPTGEKGYFNSLKATSIQSKTVVAPTTPESTAPQQVQNLTKEIADEFQDLPF